MREIKYRAWDKLLKEFIDLTKDDYAIDPEGELVKYSVSTGELMVNCEVAEINFFTGFKDKNGKEIYEGDIISFPDLGEEGYEYKEGFDFENSATVHFDNGRYELKDFRSDNSAVLEDMNEQDEMSATFKSSVIIGNIYEGESK